MPKTPEWSVSEMVSYAFRKHRAGNSTSASTHGEALVEWCIRYACTHHASGQLLLDALLPGGKTGTFLELRRQVVDPSLPANRPDLAISFRNPSSGTATNLLVELKINAALTEAQLTPGYAAVFVCSSQRLRSLENKLADTVVVKSWPALLQSIKDNNSAEHDLTLWEAICSLAEGLARDISLYPGAGVLRDQDVARNYGAALRLLGSVIDGLGHHPLTPPDQGQKNTVKFIKHGGTGQTSLLFTPESLSSPISVHIGPEKYPYSVAELGLHEDYYFEADPGNKFRLPVDADKTFDSERFGAALHELEWRRLESDAGMYIQDFLSLLRTLQTEAQSAGLIVTLIQVRLTNENVGYIFNSGGTRFYALFDARHWARVPRMGPFVFYENEDSPVENAEPMLSGCEHTWDDVEASIRSAVGTRLGIDLDTVETEGIEEFTK